MVCSLVVDGSIGCILRTYPGGRNYPGGRTYPGVKRAREIWERGREGGGEEKALNSIRPYFTPIPVPLNKFPLLLS